MTALRSGSASHPGMVRSVNQDSSLVAAPLYAVADGMGGHAAGEVASQVAVEALRRAAEPTSEGLARAVRVANRAVWDKARVEPAMRGMGTTLCAVILVRDPDGAGGDRLVVANVGDSRVYLFHDGELEQITEDHSLVEDLVREGRLTHEEARSHPQRNVVTRVLGVEEDVDVDTWEIVPYTGDRVLLCSDGLFNEVDEGTIAGVLRRHDDPDDAAAELVRLANDEGGRDNITVVLVDVVDDGGRAADASAALGATAATARSSTSRPARDEDGPDDRTAPLPATAAPGPGAGEEAPRPLTRAEIRRSRPKPKRFTWRVALFTLAVLAVLGAAGGAVTWFARSTYYVGVDGEDVVIYQGRPGGVLWIQPTLAERTDLDFQDVPPARQPDVQSGKQEATLADARRYVERLEDQAAARAATTTTTTTVAPDEATTTAPGAETTTTSP